MFSSERFSDAESREFNATLKGRDFRTWKSLSPFACVAIEDTSTDGAFRWLPGDGISRLRYWVHGIVRQDSSGRREDFTRLLLCYNIKPCPDGWKFPLHAVRDTSWVHSDQATRDKGLANDRFVPAASGDVLRRARYMDHACLSQAASEERHAYGLTALFPRYYGMGGQTSDARLRDLVNAVVVEPWRLDNFCSPGGVVKSVAPGVVTVGETVIAFPDIFVAQVEVGQFVPAGASVVRPRLRAVDVFASEKVSAAAVTWLSDAVYRQTHLTIPGQAKLAVRADVMESLDGPEIIEDVRHLHAGIQVNPVMQAIRHRNLGAAEIADLRELAKIRRDARQLRKEFRSYLPLPVQHGFSFEALEKALENPEASVDMEPVEAIYLKRGSYPWDVLRQPKDDNVVPQWFRDLKKGVTGESAEATATSAGSCQR